MKNNSCPQPVRLTSYLLLLIILMACSLGTPAGGEAPPPAIAPTENTPVPQEPNPGVEETADYFYNLPQATLTDPTGLFAAPNRPEWIVQTEIPAGDTVYVMGKNATGSHLRVVWHTGVGWIPVSFTNFIADRDKM